MEYQFSDSLAREYYKALPKSIRDKVDVYFERNQYIYDFDGCHLILSMKLLRKVVAKCSPNQHRICLKIQFVNPKKKKITHYHPHFVTLSNPNWYYELCIALQCPSITNESGIPIGKLTLDRMLRDKLKFYVSTPFDKDQYVPSKKFAEHYAIHVQSWWCRSIQTLHESVVSMFAKHSHESTIGHFLNTYHFEHKLKEEIFSNFAKAEQYKEFGCLKVDEVLVPLGVKITCIQLSEYLFSRLAPLLRFLVVAGKQALFSFVQWKQWDHISHYRENEIMYSEFVEFYQKLFSVAFSDIDQGKWFAKNIREIERCSGSTIKKRQILADIIQLYQVHIARLTTEYTNMIPKKNQKFHYHHENPNLECFTKIKTPYLSSLIHLPSIPHEKEIQKMLISNAQPISHTWIPLLDSGPTQFKNLVKKKNHVHIIQSERVEPLSINKDQMGHVTKDSKSNYLVHLPQQGKEPLKFIGLDPYRNVLIDDQGNEVSFAEHFNPADNCSILQVLLE